MARSRKVLSPRAILVPIGSEVVSGNVVDTNSAFLSRELTQLGFEVIQHVAVKDDAVMIIRVLEDALGKADLIITTGGLGPTFDDITKDVLSRISGQPLVFSPTQLKHIQDYFRKRKRKIHKSARYQAYFPRKSRIFDNRFGVAAGIGIEKEGKWLIALPGVPYEMEGLFKTEIVSFLASQFGKTKIVSVMNAKITGMSEVDVVKKLGTRFPPADNNIQCGIYPSPGEVTVRMTFEANNHKKAASLLKFWGNALCSSLGAHLISLSGESLEEVVGKLLVKRRQTLAVAESMTGGLMAKRLTDIPGSSRYVKGGTVVYCDPIKAAILGIDKRTLHRYSAVSPQTAWLMAKSVREKFRSDWAISITGNAGPGSQGRQPVGIVFVGLAGENTKVVRKYYFVGTRERIRWLASQSALDMFRRALLNE